MKGRDLQSFTSTEVNGLLNVQAQAAHDGAAATATGTKYHDLFIFLRVIRALGWAGAFLTLR